MLKTNNYRQTPEACRNDLSSKPRYAWIDYGIQLHPDQICYTVYYIILYYAITRAVDHSILYMLCSLKFTRTIRLTKFKLQSVIQYN